MKQIYNPITKRNEYAVDKNDLDLLHGLSFSDVRGLKAHYFLRSDSGQCDFSMSIPLDDNLFLFLGEVMEWWQERVDTLMNQESAPFAKQPFCKETEAYSVPESVERHG